MSISIYIHTLLFYFYFLSSRYLYFFFSFIITDFVLEKHFELCLIYLNQIEINYFFLSFLRQVLFCSLTDEQKKLYKKYLCSEDVTFILHEKNNHDTGRYRARFLIALSALRKICNHPDLFLYSREFVRSSIMLY